LTTVLIPSPTDLAQTTALRALGARGDVCDVAWQQSKFPISRYCRNLLSAPDAGSDPAAYARHVLKLCETGVYDVVLPTSINTVEALLPHIDSLNRLTHTLLPTIQQVEIGMDKRRTIETCRDQGFAYPDSVFLTEESNLENIAEAFGFPLIVKHQRNFGGSYGVRCVSEMSKLRSTIRELVKLGGTVSDCIIQKFIPGALFDACAVARNGKVAVMVTQVRRLMYPISGGVAAHLITVDEPRLTALATKIIASLHWTGPLQLEFKWDAEKHEFLLIEINPRFWGTTGAWLRAGLNFPGVAVDLAMGRDVPGGVKLDKNLRFKYLIGRTPYALIQLFRARGFADMRDPIKFSKTWYDFDIRDPGPDLWRVYEEFRKVMRGDRLLVDKTLPPGLIPAYTDIPE
jgi:predicted ATP-grasp superfamily ATP-dependent carboligase